MKKVKNKRSYKMLAGFLTMMMVCTTNVPAKSTANARDSATENLARTATIETEQASGWAVPDWIAPSYLNDGVTVEGGISSSNYEVNANAVKTVTLTFADNKAASVKNVVLYPRVENGISVGFPENFTVSTWDGKQWVEAGTSTGHKNERKPVEVLIDETCNAIRITATVLGISDNVDQPYVLQLREVEVWGSYTGEILMAPDSVFAAYPNNIAPKAVEVKAQVVTDDWAQYYGSENLNDGNTDGSSGDGEYGWFYTSKYTRDSKEQQTIEIVFGDDYGIEGIVLYPRVKSERNYNGFPQEFKVEVFDISESSWKQVATGTASPDVKGYVANPVRVPFDSTVAGRSVRITVTELGHADNAEEYALQLAEIAVLGSANIAPFAMIEAEQSTADWAQQTWLGPEYLIDHVTSKDGGFYVSDTTAVADTEKTIEFDFANFYDMSEVILYPRLKEESYNGFPQEYTIEVHNGTFWKQVARGKSNGDVLTPVTVPFDSVCGSKLRITVTRLGCFDSQSNYGIQLAEVSIFGSVADAGYYNLEKGAYQVGKNATVNGWTSIEVSGDYRASVEVDGKTSGQKVYLWKSADAHPDNTIDARDLVALKKMVSGRTLTTRSGMKACDMNEDGIVNMADMTLFRNKVLKISDILPTAGRIYYVDSNALDNQDGLTPDKALKSMEQVNKLSLQPGDYVLLKKGCEWNDTQLRISASGTEELPIVFGSYGEGESLPVINANGRYFAAVQGEDISNVRIEGLEVTNRSDYSKNLRGISIEARNLKVSGISIYGCYVHDVQGSPEALQAGEDPHHNGGIVLLSGTGSVRNKSICLSNIFIERNCIKDCSLLGIIAGSIEEKETSRSTDISVRNNQIYGSQGDGIILHIVDDSVIEYNTVGFNGLCEKGTFDDKAYAAVWCFGSSDVCIQYNEVYGQHKTPKDAQAFDIDLWCENITIQYNYSHDNAGGFLLVMDSWTSATHTVRYNVSKNDRGRLISASMAYYDEKEEHMGFPHVDLYNNTFYSNGLDMMFLFPAGEGRNGKYFMFQNNIFCLPDMTMLYEGTDPENRADPAIAFSRITFQGNCWYGVDSFKSSLKDETGIWMEPEFVNYGVGVDAFKLKTNSPCKGAGNRVLYMGFPDLWNNKKADSMNIGAFLG